MKRWRLSAAAWAFGWIWAGQAVSLLGSAMTSFALTVWIWQTTGKATTIALVELCSFAPVVFIGPVAGAWVDRSNRRLVMLASDAGAAGVTLVLLALHLTWGLEAWYLYVAKVVVGTCLAFQSPAYTAIVTVLLPKEQYSRASGLLSLAFSSSWAVAPALAAVGLGVVGLTGILCFDLLTFGVAALTVLLVKIPPVPSSPVAGGTRPTLWRDALFGFGYIRQRPSLLGLQVILFFSNLFAMFGILLAPMVLARSGNSEIILGTVQFVGAVGGMAGGLCVSLWAGFERRIHGVLLSLLAIGILGQVLMGVGRSVWIWSLSAFLASFFFPLFQAANQALWQSKVGPEIQGRVFAARRLIAETAGPMTMIVAGPLADRVFEPAMAPGGELAASFGWLVGTGAGSGMALMYVASGFLGAATAVVGYGIRSVREIDSLLPDHDTADRRAVGAVEDASAS